VGCYAGRYVGYFEGCNEGLYAGRYVGCYAGPRSLAWQPCPAALPGSLARQPCPAAFSGMHHSYFYRHCKLCPQLKRHCDFEPCTVYKLILPCERG
jgi:hypothetical protein